MDVRKALKTHINMIKTIQFKLTVNSILNGEISMTFSLKAESKQKLQFFKHYSGINTEKQRTNKKRRKSFQKGKKITYFKN